MHSNPSNRQDLEFVIFPWWPTEKKVWIGDDELFARRLIPGNRVFVREHSDSEFATFRYGEWRIRTRPILHRTIRGDGLVIGDRVEVYTRMGLRSLIADIAEMHYNEYQGRIDYRLRIGDLVSGQIFMAKDFRRVVPPLLPPMETQIQINRSAGTDPYRLM